MKLISFLALFAALATANTELGLEPGHLLQRSVGISPAATPEEICNGGYTPKCGDCATMLTCLGPTTPPRSASCPPDKPYCDPNRNMCSAVPPTVPCEEGLVGGSFTCTQPNGIFPHPTNCSQYYDCANGNAFLGECNTNQVWSGTGMMCKQKKLSSDCGTFNCNKYPGQLRPYSINNSYYAWCGEVVNGQQEIIVLKCERPNEYFTGKMCEFQCKDVKLYADPLDAAWYYDCYRSGTTFLYDHRQCTLNRLFDEPSQSCV